MDREVPLAPIAELRDSAGSMTSRSRFCRLQALGAVTLLVVVASCGSGSGLTVTTPDGGSPDAAPPASGLPDGGHIVPSGTVPKTTDCETDADCPSHSCVPLIPNGFRICVERGVEATAPSAIPGQCDSSRPCPSGKCYQGFFYPSGICGLGGVSPENVCRVDECASDAACANGLCGPAGLTSDSSVSGGGIRECFHAACRSNADCSAHAGGVCGLISGFCAAPHDFVRAQVACVYPGGCFAASDCCNGACGTCQVVNGAGVCVQ
jgi:hypothetical protein